ncbi:claw keratin-like [Lacerta agilis]|uniref:claw keratin-like n=1 Tax=Lacerta agilis TaxID=80427 RepID=UPI00141A0981|nr:claw keratin-like [Lacerta agilis]
MVDCGPSCAVPSWASTPTVGFGSAGGLGYGGLGYGLGGLGSGFGGFGQGYGGLGYGYGGAERAANLGVLSGVVPSCINQIPPAEVVIQPPASVLTIPGPILSASCEPVAVGGNTPCAVGGSGLVGGYGYGSGLLGSNFGGFLGGSNFGLRRGELFGRKTLLGRRGSVCV